MIFELEAAPIKLFGITRGWGLLSYNEIRTPIEHFNRDGRKHV